MERDRKGEERKREREKEREKKGTLYLLTIASVPKD